MRGRRRLDRIERTFYTTAMPLVRQDSLTRPSPFHLFICDGCGKPLGKHWLFRPEKLQDVMYVADTKGRAPNGRYYCNRSQTAWAGSYHQRELRRTMVAGYEHSK